MKGYSDAAIDIILKSWRSNTLNQYAVYIKLWFLFAKQGIEPNVLNIIEFLSYLHSKNYKYYQLCAARSAVATLADINDIGKHPDIKRFMKGIFELEPQLPVYTTVWDVSVVFTFFRQLDTPADLTMEFLGKKLAILICLLAGGQRSQTVHAIQVTDIKVTSHSCIIPIYSKIKQTRPGKHIKPLEFNVFTSEPKLCVVEHLTHYLAKTKMIRKSSALFLSYQKPHQAVSKDTIARWCRDMMTKSGIDPLKYVTHSCRSAASSMAKKNKFPLSRIIEACGWSTERTFALHYNKEIHSDERHTIGESLIS